MTRSIAFVLFPGFIGLDLTGPLEVFNTAALLLKARGHAQHAYHFCFVAKKKGPVVSLAGLSVLADTFADECQPHTLFVPGGQLESGFAQETELQQLVSMLAVESTRIVSVCSGAHLLAACGLLKGKRVTTHWSTAQLLEQNYPEISVDVDSIYVRDGNISTSAGVATGIDLALALVEEDFGVDIAMEVSRQLVVYRHRPGHQSQFSAPLKAQMRAGKRFVELHRWLEEHLSEELTVEQLAAQTAMSPRHFARVFHAETGLSPGKYLEQLRLDKARELLEAGENHLQTIADQAGFGRAERLRKVFMRQLGVTPSQYLVHFSN